MNKFITYIALAMLTLIAAPSETRADSQHDPFTCVSTQYADLAQSGSVPVTCISMTLMHCVSQINPVRCLDQMTNNRTEFVERLLSRLPSDLDNTDINPLTKRRYSRHWTELNLGTWREETVSSNEDCTGMGPGYDAEVNQAICNFWHEPDVLVLVVYLAELAGISVIET